MEIPIPKMIADAFFELGEEIKYAGNNVGVSDELIRQALAIYEYTENQEGMKRCRQHVTDVDRESYRSGERLVDLGAFIDLPSEYETINEEVREEVKRRVKSRLREYLSDNGVID